MAKEDYDLEASIKQHGVLVPIYKSKMGNIIDGRHKEAICEKLGIKPTYVTIEKADDEANEIVYDLVLNCHRRTVSMGERRAKLQRLLQLRPELKTVQQIADVLNIPARTVYTWFPQEKKKATRPVGEKIAVMQSSQQTTMTTTSAHPCVCKDLSNNHWEALTKCAEKTSKTIKETLEMAIEALALHVLSEAQQKNLPSEVKQPDL